MRRTRSNRTALLILAGLATAGVLGMLDGFDRPVRCRDGHLFTTIWIPLASLKAIRLGRQRFQRCPVGHHWSMVTRVDRTTAPAAELEAAAAVHDLRIP
ncbi:MAG TPA: hypothetical protein VIH92_09190 [Solirubrobacteraceae bacterium]